ncbi:MULTISPECIES: helix-turn-helix transcriptional regulator [unclassified Jeotgalibaca]|uniref:helix-turn-helix transcriptional regulator n=1 Tax=unclassified Jeotgalibaca TaxID=2621505 RepID=UPI003FD32702
MSLKMDAEFQNRMELIDAKEINYRYEMEERMITAIMHGSYEEYVDLFKLVGAPNNFDTRVIRMQDDYLRDRKNGLITRKTLMRVAAKYGGVPPVYLHLMSEKFATLIENATSAKYLDEVLAHDMAKAFCDMVRDFSMKNYTAAIRDVILYVDAHFTDDVSVNHVAEALHFHPAYLSRKFKQETGRNLTEYVNYQRIEYAKMLFRTGKTVVTNVALNCGFNSSSYFSKVFKNYTGCFPTEYMKQMAEED